MSDLLLQISTNKRARKLVTTLGLPLPMPEKLARGDGPWEERPLADRAVVVWTAADSPIGEVLASTLTEAGAEPWLVADAAALGPWKVAGEAWGRPPHVADADTVAVAPARPWALVFDATTLKTPADLRHVYDFFHPRIKSLSKSGRLLVIGRTPESASDDAQAAAFRALEGFVKSAGREIGRVGATANLLLVDPGAEDRLPPVVRFMLSVRSTYVSGQPLRVTKKCRATQVRAVRPLEGKVALVTGAARGIGSSIAETFAREGAQVIVLDRPDDDAPGSEVARKVGGVFLGVDVTDPGAADTIAAFVKEKYGKLDVIVHNAGITRDRTLAKLSPEWWDLTLEVNTNAVLRLTEGLEPVLGKDARLVCLSSIAGIAGNVGQTNYSASKAAIIGFVQSAAPRLARKGIAINAIAPGFIETRLTDAIPVATREVARRLCNLGQGGLPVDIAEVATFLASPGAHGISGQVLRVCGGSFVGA
ncbi:MAG: 3-oxoacyl-ACP reductase [Alphaproteobacteria bacterium]|nr:3-oxoacyl-ACP reductase [Alphaproteobacteria bacterium]MCB9698479.1 3-oxoacyl-ACP reductase [Alphaproteobacteria bacterium]